MAVSILRAAKSIMTSAVERQDAADRMDEKAMLDRCKMGDEHAIRWVLNHYRARLIRVAAHVLRNSREAEDVAQEAFVKAFRSLDQFKGTSRFYIWLYRIVVNLCLDRMRRKYISSEIPLDAVTPAELATTPDLDTRLAVVRILEALSPPLRAAIVLREIEGLEYSQIAKVLNISAGAVRSRLYMARKEFRRRWTELMQETDRV